MVIQMKTNIFSITEIETGLKFPAETLKNVVFGKENEEPLFNRLTYMMACGMAAITVIVAVLSWLYVNVYR